MSAHELLKSIGMHEESIRCLFMAGRTGQAVEMAEKHMETAKVKNFNMLCLMGEMKSDHTYWERAWEESKGRCGKAMRNLGKYWFYEKNFEKAIECYELGLAVNKLYPATWFTLGVAYMKIHKFKEANYAFGNVVSIDGRETDAWANIASCQIAMKQYFQAVTCCEQALKINRRSWKIWNNYILFSIETLQFYKAVSGINQLLISNRLEDINPGLYVKLTDMFVKRYVQGKLHENDPARHDEDLKDGVEKITEADFLRHKKYLYKSFDRIT